MTSVDKGNPGFWVVVHTAGQSIYSDDVTQRPHPKRGQSWVCAPSCTLTLSKELPVWSHYSCWANWSCSPFQKGWRKSSIKKSIYVVWFHLIIIYDVNNFKEQLHGKPWSLPFQAWIPALPLPVSATQSQSPLSKIEKIIPTP